jgi:lysophospholipase L1-like esterase
MRTRRLVRDAALMVLIAAGLLAAAEGGVRIVERLRTGRWPATQASAFHAAIRGSLTRLFRPHPYLNAAPREGSRVLEGRGQRTWFNALGYRSPDRPREKPPDAVRVVCAGGSTTYDALALTNENSWPWQLETGLAATGRTVEVWNAGVPGWTSLENLIALEIRDVDLSPDLVLLYQGINDLQPGAQEPFSAQYEGVHAEAMRIVLGIGLPGLPWYERSVLFEKVRDAFGLTPPTTGAVSTATKRHERLPAEAVATFRRNVRSFVAVARAHGARVLLATQPLRLRAGHEQEDVAYLERWIPDLAGTAAPRELERLNQTLRELAVGPDVLLADVTRDIPWSDGDFSDPMHYTNAGRAQLVAFFASRVPAALQ